MYATILVIDDAAEIRENISEILTMDNYRVLTAANGREGVQLALDKHPDLIICDIVMPVLDGYGVLYTLQKKGFSSHTPFIFLSGRTERADMRKGMEMGADDYLPKPFDPVDLLHCIEVRLKKSRQLKKGFAPDIQGLYSLMQTVSPKDALDGLWRNKHTNMYGNGQHIYASGNYPDYLYYIVKGKVKTSRRNESGKEIITRVYNEGEFLGYKALLENSKYEDDAEVIEEAHLVLIPRKDFELLLYNNMEVTKAFVRMLTANIDENENHLLGLAYSSLRKKVAEALLYLYGKYNPAKSPGFSLDVGRDNIAAIAGVAKESLIRTLGSFRDERLITIREGMISLEDTRKLERMLN
ncbi:response regulator [Chitinophaga alhagiae]|uniref:response regulator n=1 Tax=Chitinophaga alhagiae TaxID=2203219 RepID=UPI000E5C4652|nr:response regulator [Chitinophaga alhagiae]